MDNALPRIAPVSDADYHSDKEWITRGMLMDFRESPRLFHKWHVARTEEKPQPKNPRVGIGEAAHKALLQPHLFDSIVREIPASVLNKKGGEESAEGNRGKKYHEWAAQWEPGTVLLKEKEVAVARAMCDALLEHFGNLLKHATHVECGIWWTDPLTGIKCKIKPDVLLLSEGLAPIILDIKTTTDCRKSAFQKRIEQQCLWMQDRHYSAGVRQLTVSKEHPTGIEPDFVFIVADETGNPPAAYRLSEQDKASASDVREQTLMQLFHSRESGDWSCNYEGQITELTLNPWTYSA